MSDETTELAPCPICGFKANVFSWWSEIEECGMASIGCAKESYVNGFECARIHVNRIDEKTALEDAIRIWNTRAELGSEPPYDELLRCLENDWRIKASWDCLRKFLCIELTEEGVKLRDVTHGTLTVEQVREAIEKRFDFDVWVPKERWQAIADELNAELGSGTCENAELCRLCGFEMVDAAGEVIA